MASTNVKTRCVVAALALLTAAAAVYPDQLVASIHIGESLSSAPGEGQPETSGCLPFVGVPSGESFNLPSSFPFDSQPGELPGSQSWWSSLSWPHGGPSFGMPSLAGWGSPYVNPMPWWWPSIESLDGCEPWLACNEEPESQGPAFDGFPPLQAPSGLTLDTNPGLGSAIGNGWQFNEVSTAVICVDPTAQVIPEPASMVVWAVLAIGGIARAWRQRRATSRRESRQP